MRTRAAAALVLAAGLCVAGPALAATAPASSALFTYRDPAINESSGIAPSSFDDTVYTQNDSGDAARFFRVDARGNTIAVYTLRGASNVDWEDMATGDDAAGEPVLYFADIGDNDHNRKEIAVYAVPEPHGPSADVTWTRYRFTYPDGPHDAEALLVDPRTRRIYIATKELLKNGKVYEAPASPSPTDVNPLTSIGTDPPLTTSGDFAPDGSRVVLLTYVGAIWADDVGAPWHRLDVPLPPQAEAIAYTHDGSSVLVGGEGRHSAVYRAPAPEPRSPTSTSPKPAGQPSDAATPGAAAPSAQPSASSQSHAREWGSRMLVIAIIGVFALLLVAIFVVCRRRNR